MTIVFYVLCSVYFALCFAFVIFMGFDVVSDYIKEHRYDRRFKSEPYTVKNAKHLFCELYQNASEYEVFESTGLEGYSIQRKYISMGRGYQTSYRDLINDDFDKPVDDEE